MSNPYAKLPAWAEYILIPVLNLAVAFLVAGLVVLLVGENPLDAAYYMITGAFGRGEYIGFTLYYATTFIFTGLSVAVAFHAGLLFNIGSEGQAYIGGIGVALACLWLDKTMPWFVVFPLAIIGSAAFGALWAFLPGWLQAKRGSHVVITTIMFNFIASSLMVYLLTRVLKPLGQMAPQTRTFEAGGQLPKLDWLMSIFGLNLGNSPFNVSFLLALLAAFGVWVLIWRTKLGYEMRTMGHSPSAARFAGIGEARIIVIVMMISGGLAGMMALNPIMGEQYRMQLDFVQGAAFRRHRGGADGPLASGRHHPGCGPVRHALSGRRRNRLRNARHLARHDRHHPGPGHPLRRSAGKHVPPGDRPRLCRDRPPFRRCRADKGSLSHGSFPHDHRDPRIDHPGLRTVDLCSTGRPVHRAGRGVRHRP